ncbi:MAG: ADOP family duplicated permease, partial [Acidobacteriota bacterium]
MFTRGRKPEEFRREIEAHIAHETSRLIDAGMGAEEAAAQARRTFGNLTRVQEGRYEWRRWMWWDDLRQDLRHAGRGMRRAPGFALAAIFTLALGIGSATAVFSVVDPLLFRSLPYPKDSQLISFGYFGPVDSNEFAVVSSYLDWRREQGPFQGMTSMRPGTRCDLVISERATQRGCVAVETNFLHMFGVQPLMGRSFTREDAVAGAPPVALISSALWQEQFGGDRTVVGRKITIEEELTEVIGVLPRTFEMPQLGDVDVLRATRYSEAPRPSNSSALVRTFGRLRDGVSVEQGRAQMEPLMRASAKLDVPKELASEVRYVFRPLRDRQIQDVKAASWFLLGAVLTLLLIACANVANLMLARATGRSREFALRLAIGAGRGRLARQQLTESFVLALMGGAAGCVGAWVLLQVFTGLAPEGLLRLDRAEMNWRVLAFTIAVSAAAALLAGAWPALQRMSSEGLLTTKPAGRVRSGVRLLLVPAQVALSLVLLSGAAFLVESLNRLQNQNLGFQPEHVVIASFALRQQRYASPAAQAAFAQEMERRLASIPNVEAFGLTDAIPPQGAQGRPYSNMRVEGKPRLEANGGLVNFRRVTPGYFRAMGIPILAGRAFSETDRRESGAQLVLGASLSRKMFGLENPVGARVAISGDETYATVVGVAGDTRNNGLAAEPYPEYYVLRMSDGRGASRETVAVFRTTQSPQAMANAVQREMRGIDASLPVEVRSLEQHIRGFQQRPRFVAMLASLFAGIGV